MSNKPEDVIQASAFKWFHNNYCLNHHEPRLQMFSVPNETLSYVWKHVPKKMAQILSGRAKAMGLKPGVSDTIIVLPGKVLFVEFKTATGAQKPRQKDFQKTVSGLGHEYHIVRSLEEFKELILAQMK